MTKCKSGVFVLQELQNNSHFPTTNIIYHLQLQYVCMYGELTSELTTTRGQHSEEACGHWDNTFKTNPSSVIFLLCLIPFLLPYLKFNSIKFNLSI